MAQQPLLETDVNKDAYEAAFSSGTSELINPIKQAEVGASSFQEQQGAAIVQDNVSQFKPNRLNALAQAFSENNLISSGLNYAVDFVDSTKFDYDPDFEVNKNPDYFDGVDPMYWDELQSSKSLTHLQELATKYGKKTDTASYLDSLGVEGVLYRVSGVFADVPLISGFQKVAAVGKAGVFLSQLSNSYVGRALIAGTVEGSFEGIKQITSPEERSELDMILALGAGSVFGGLYNPKAIDASVKATMTELAQETVNARGLNKPLSTSERIKKAVENAQFNVTSVFQKAPSETMRNIGDSLFHNVLNPVVEKFKAIEIRDNVKASIDSALSLNFDPLYLEFVRTIHGKKFNILGRFASAKQEEFFNLAGKRFYKIDDPMFERLTPEYLAKLDGALDKMGKDAFDVLQRNGHAKFVDGTVEKADNYMPLRWMKDKIQTLSGSGQFARVDFRNAVRDGLAKQMDNLKLNVPKERLDEAAESFTETLYRQNIDVGQAGYIMQDNIMKRALSELTDLLKLTDEEASLLESQVRATGKNASKPLASSANRRTPLDLEGSFTNAEGYTVRLKDFIDTNVQGVWHNYSTSMGGDTALRALNVGSREELQALRSQVVSELSNATGKVPAPNQKYLDNFDNAVGHLLGMSPKRDPNGDAWKTVRLLNNLTRATKLGGTWFAMAAELASVTNRVGFANMVKSLPALRQVFRAYRGKEFDEVFQEIRLIEGLGSELNQMSSIAKYEDNVAFGITEASESLITKFLTKAEKVSDSLSEATMVLGGVKSGTAMLEHMHSIAARVKMMKMARKGLDKKGYEFFEMYGFNKETADLIAGQINKFASKDLNKPLLNLDKWDNGLGQKWSLGVRRQSYTLVQKANYGDNVAITLENKLIGDTPLGAIALSLKQYMTVAYNKQLSKGVMNLASMDKSSLDTLANWGYQTAFLSLSYTAKQYANYGNNPEELDKRLQPEVIAKNVFSMSTFSTFLPSMIDTASEFAADETVFNTYSRGEPAGLPGLPALEYIGQVYKGTKGIANYVSPAADASAADIRNAFNMLPFNNIMGMKQLTNTMAEALAEE
jgi:hypothetical protein